MILSWECFSGDAGVGRRAAGVSVLTRVGFRQRIRGITGAGTIFLRVALVNKNIGQFGGREAAAGSRLEVMLSEETLITGRP